MVNYKESDQRFVILRAIEQIQQLASLFTKRRAQLARRVGVTEAQWRLLEGIAQEHFVPSMFAREQVHTKGAVSKITRQLLDKKLVRVSIAEHDGRQRQYELTRKGEKLMDQLRILREDAIEEIWVDVPKDDLATLTRVNDALITGIREYAKREE